jgi:hypothetical protein
MVEFTIVAIPIIFMTTSILEMSLESWKFHSMVYAIDMAARYACGHGRTCTKNSNTCTISVQDVASVITNQAPALDTSKLNVSLITHSTTTNCNPISTCLTNTTQFPNATDNGVGLDIKITASYTMYNPIPMMWFGTSGSSGQNYTLGATTRQTIVY